MFIFTLKSTGETIVLPTPSGDKETIIDTLPKCEKNEELDKEYFKFKEEFKKKNL